MSSVRLIAGLIVSSFFAIGLQAQELPFLDGFDDPADDLWTLERGWQLHADENVSTLHGRGHSWARLRAEPQWSDYALRTRISLDVGGIHIVFRHGEQGRYFFGVRDDVAYLQKESPWGTFKELAIREQDMELGRWFDVEIRAQRGRLRIYRDEELLFDVSGSSGRRERHKKDSW